MRGPLDTPPEETGWWLASDDKWYPPERPPSWAPPATPPRTSRSFLSYLGEPPNSLTLALVALAGLVSAWLAIAWDLSEIDAHGKPIEPHEVAAWRVPIAFLLLVGVVVIATRLHPEAWLWIGVAAAVGVEVWVTWRGSVARTNGANMFLVLALIMAPPVLVLTMTPAWIVQFFTKRSTRSRQHTP